MSNTALLDRPITALACQTAAPVLDPPVAPIPVPPDTAPETDINVDLLRRTLHHIEANPHQHDQGRWTTCFAAHVVAQHRGGPAFPGGPATYPDLDYTYGQGVSGTDPHVSGAARAALRISEIQAGALFYAGSIHELWQLAEKFTGSAIYRNASI